MVRRKLTASVAQPVAQLSVPLAHALLKNARTFYSAASDFGTVRGTVLQSTPVPGNLMSCGPMHFESLKMVPDEFSQ